MKKNMFFAGLVMAVFGLTACDEDYTDWAQPQTNGEETPAATVATVLGNGEVSNIVFNEADDVLNIALSQGVSDAAYTIKSYNQVLLNGSYDVPFTEEDGNISVTKVQLDSVARIASNSRAYVEREYTLTLKTFVANAAGQAFSALSNPVTITYKPVPTPALEEAYYLVGDFNGWNLSTAGGILMTAKGEGVFEAEIDNVPDNCWWKLFPKSATENGDWGGTISAAVNGESTNGGFLAWAEELGGEPGAFLIENGGKLRFTVDMVNMTYSVVPAVANLYIPGNANGWSLDTAPMLAGNGDGTFTGYAYLNGDFKFTFERSWEDGEFNFSNFTSLPDGFSQGEGTNINAAEKAFYLLNVNMSAGTLSAEKTVWGIIGPGQAGGWDTDTDMEYNESEGCWEATVELAADDIKFRANDGWDINVGGSFDNLEANGANIAVPEAGTYVVKLYLARSASDKMYATLTKQ